MDEFPPLEQDSCMADKLVSFKKRLMFRPAFSLRLRSRFNVRPYFIPCLSLTYTNDQVLKEELFERARSFQVSDDPLNKAYARNTRRTTSTTGLAVVGVSAQEAPSQHRASTGSTSPRRQRVFPGGACWRSTCIGRRRSHDAARPGNPSRPYLLQPWPAPGKFPGRGKAAGLRTNKYVCT